MPQVIEATETTALAVIETMSGAELFKPGTIDPILDRIKAEVRAVKTDISTDAGRKAIASLAFKVAKSKTFLDKVRVSLVEGEKKRLKAIDAEGSRIWDELEALQKEVRQPLTEWENAEKERIAGHEAAIAAIPESSMYGARESSEEIANRLFGLEWMYGTRDWQEFGKRAKESIDAEIVRTKLILESVTKREVEAADLSRLRAEQAAREQQEREDAIAKAARDKAEEEARKREAAALAAAERERQRVEAEKFRVEAEAKAAKLAAEIALQVAENQRLHAEEKAERERLAAVDEREAAIARAAEYAKRVETDRIAAEEKAAAEAVKVKNAWERAQDLERRRVEREKEEAARIAEENAKTSADLAVELERQRVEENRLHEAREAEMRAKNRAHRAAINREIVQALMVADGVDEAIAKSIVQLIALGQVPHTKISY